MVVPVDIVARERVLKTRRHHEIQLPSPARRGTSGLGGGMVLLHPHLNAIFLLVSDYLLKTKSFGPQPPLRDGCPGGKSLLPPEKGSLSPES